MPKDAKSKKYIKQGNYIAAAMHERKKGILHSGSPKGPKVTSRAQAVAIGFSMMRAAAQKKKKSHQDTALLGPHGKQGGHAGRGK